MNLGPYAKAASATVVAGFTAAIGALADGGINGVEWAGIAVTVLVAAGAVYAVPNFPSRARSYAKAITAGLVGGLGSLGIALTDGGGVSQAEWLTIAIAVLVGAGLVSQVPNALQSGEVIQSTQEFVGPKTNPHVAYGSTERTVELGDLRDLDGDGRDDTTGRFV